MDLKGFYEDNKEKYEIVLRRFNGREDLIHKFLLQFLKDLTFQSLEKAINDNDFDNILNYAHTLKGISLNLGFEKLGNYSAIVVNSARQQQYDNLETQFKDIKDEYERIVTYLSN